jgi:branched-chain amino acid transport system substrate-binding protein
MKGKSFQIFFAIVCAILFTVNQAYAAPSEIVIGATAPLTGPAAEAGIALKQGITMLVEEWNAKGGIQIKEAGKKLPIKVIIEDSQSKPEVGVSVGEKLITRDKVHFLMGDCFASSVTMAMMELAPKYGIPMMSVEPVSIEIAKKVESNPQRYWSFWKGDWNSDAYANTIFSTYKYLLENKMFAPKNKTIAFIVEDTDYGRSNAERSKQLFSDIGWKTVATETVALGYTDFYPQLTKLKTMEPDILVTIFTSLASGVAHSKQFHEVGLKASQFAIYYPLRPEYRDQAGKAGEGLLWSPLNFDPAGNPKHKEFADKVQQRWNVKASSDHISGYDGANNVLHSIEKAGTLDPKTVVEALSKLDLPGYFGRYVFDQKNHTIKDGESFLPVPTAQIQDGNHVMVWPPSMAPGKYKKQAWVQD